jgi:hypothetical protein
LYFYRHIDYRPRGRTHRNWPRALSCRRCLCVDLIGFFLVGYIIDFLAGTFGARKNLASAMKVSAYAPTAAWLAGVFNILPALSFLSILGLYSLYLLYTGIGTLMRPAASNALIYTIAVIVCAIIVWVVILAIPAMLFGMGMMM